MPGGCRQDYASKTQVDANTEKKADKNKSKDDKSGKTVEDRNSAAQAIPSSTNGPLSRMKRGRVKKASSTSDMGAKNTRTMNLKNGPKSLRVISWCQRVVARYSI